MRASQILDNERRREEECQEQELYDARLLAECKQKLAEEKEAQVCRDSSFCKNQRTTGQTFCSSVESSMPSASSQDIGGALKQAG